MSRGVRDCKYCTHYRADIELSKVYWQLTQEDKAPQIGRCVANGKEFGNAVIADGRHSDAENHFRDSRYVSRCPDYEERPEPKFKVGDVFVKDGCKSAVVLKEIQPEYYPREYRMGTILGGGWSDDEESLMKYKRIYRSEE